MRRCDRPMFDTAFFRALLDANYDANLHSLIPYPSSFVSDVRAVCRVVLADGSSWNLRVGRSDVAVPDWLVGCGAETTTAFFASRGATLQYLEEHDYSAPGVILTRSGEIVGEANGWCCLATTFVDGDVDDPAPSNLHGMAAALGKLHQLPVERNQSHDAPGQSWWFPEVALPAVLQQYAELRPNLPKQWEATVDAFCATIRCIQGSTLPRAVIHGDAWAGNAVASQHQQIVLIDWEPSGQGIAILDLGRLLLHAHQRLAAPTAVPQHIEASLIAAVIDGYCQIRMPTPGERAVLLDAIRFSVAFGAASHFSNALRAGWSSAWTSKLTRRQAWYDRSEAIAEAASTYLS